MPPSAEEEAPGSGCSVAGFARQEMVFSLPLVCRLGRPTTLDHMSQRSLVMFVTFMLHHALNVDEPTANAVKRLVQMWPNELRHEGPDFEALSKCEPGRLRRLVRGCYRTLGCELLLPISAALERQNNRGRLRLRRNGDGTSSLCERLTDRPVVTCRDDNLDYDRRGAQAGDRSARRHGTPSLDRTNPTLLPPDPSAGQPPSCPQCGAQFVTLAAAMAHERLCDAMGVNDNGSDCESLRSEPTEHSVGQAQFLSYVDLAPAAGSKQQAYLSPSRQRQQRRDKRQRCWPTAELLLRMSRTDFSSPLGRRMLDLATKQTAGDGITAAARVDRYCCSRAVRAPKADFPVCWSAPAPKRRARDRPHQYSFTARQRVERASAIRTGLSARAQTLYGRLRPCSVPLSRLNPAAVGAAARVAEPRRQCWSAGPTDAGYHPPEAAAVLLPRLTDSEITAGLVGDGEPATPSGKTAGEANHGSGIRAPPPLNGGVRQAAKGDRRKLLRDECKAIRDEHFFRLLGCEGRVTRGGDHGVSGDRTRRPVACQKRQALSSSSEEDSSASDSEEDLRWETRPALRRRMSLIGSVRGRLHSKSESSDWEESPSPSLIESEAQMDVANGAKSGVGAGRPASPERASPHWSPHGSDELQRKVPDLTMCRGSSAARDPARRIGSVALNHLMADECKTLRDKEFVQLLNRPARTTRSAASQGTSAERRSVSVWLHWPGFAREPDHHTPVKHARATGQPRCSVPTVRLERLFSRLEPTSSGGRSRRQLALVSASGGRTSRCRRRLSLNGGSVCSAAHRVSRCRRKIFPESGEGSVGGGEEQSVLVSRCKRRLSLDETNSAMELSCRLWPDGRPLSSAGHQGAEHTRSSDGLSRRRRGRPRKRSPETVSPRRQWSVGPTVANIDDHRVEDSPRSDGLNRRRRGRPRKASSEIESPRGLWSVVPVLAAVGDNREEDILRSDGLNRRGPGRPKKASSETESPRRLWSVVPVLATVGDERAEDAPWSDGLNRRPRGRPRKNSLDTTESPRSHRLWSVGPILASIDDQHAKDAPWSDGLNQRRRGRPRKNSLEMTESPRSRQLWSVGPILASIDDQHAKDAPWSDGLNQRRRGRPRKNSLDMTESPRSRRMWSVGPILASIGDQHAKDAPLPDDLNRRRRGRPRKTPLETKESPRSQPWSVGPTLASIDDQNVGDAPLPDNLNRRRRGRPRKTSLETTESPRSRQLWSVGALLASVDEHRAEGAPGSESLECRPDRQRKPSLEADALCSRQLWSVGPIL